MTLLWIQLICSVAMTTTIILVQWLIYPQFSSVGIPELSSYSQLHTHRISYIVVPIMILEAISLIGLWTMPQMRSLWLGIASSILGLIWLITFVKIVPIHHAIGELGNSELINQLVQLNALRVGLWVAKLIMVMGLIWVTIAPQIYSHKVYTLTSDTPFNQPNGHTLELPLPIETSRVYHAITPLAPQILVNNQHQIRAIVRTPLWKFPDLLIVTFDKTRTVLWSQSLLGYSDLGTNKKRLNRLKKEIDQ